MQRIWGKHLQVETTANIIGAHSREPVAQQGGKVKPVCTAWHRKNEQSSDGYLHSGAAETSVAPHSPVLEASSVPVMMRA